MLFHAALKTTMGRARTAASTPCRSRGDTPHSHSRRLLKVAICEAVIRRPGRASSRNPIAARFSFAVRTLRHRRVCPLQVRSRTGLRSRAALVVRETTSARQPRLSVAPLPGRSCSAHSGCAPESSPPAPARKLSHTATPRTPFMDLLNVLLPPAPQLGLHHPSPHRLPTRLDGVFLG